MNRIESHEAQVNPVPIAANEAMEWLGRLRATDLTESEQADFAAWLVQIKASQGCIGAVIRSAIASIAVVDAVVCVIPHRLQDASPNRERCLAHSPSPGPGR